MRIEDVEIPQTVFERLERFVRQGGKTEAAIEFEALKLLLVEGITDTERRLAGSLAALVRETVH